MELSRLKKKGKAKGWYSRGYLPHFDGAVIQFLTFRLSDSLPKGLLERWKAELRSLRHGERKLELYRRVEAYADQGIGSCILTNMCAAKVIETGILAQHGDAYELYGWCVMPNHVHLLAGFREEADLASVMQGLKGASARAINVALGRRGSVWAREYFDRYMRSQKQFDHTLAYIHQNPIKAGLCREAVQWIWGSARHVFVPAEDGLSTLSFERLLELSEEAKPRWNEMRNASRLKSAVLKTPYARQKESPVPAD